jgi:hypothetical protein
MKLCLTARLAPSTQGGAITLPNGWLSLTGYLLALDYLQIQEERYCGFTALFTLIITVGLFPCVSLSLICQDICWLSYLCCFLRCVIIRS